jgi:hypothetical protein
MTIPFGRYRRRWEDFIKIDLKRNRTCECGLDCVGLALGPVVGSCERGKGPSVSIKVGKVL